MNSSWVKVTKALENYDGSTLMAKQADGTEKPYTIRAALLLCLGNVHPFEENDKILMPNTADKIIRYHICVRIGQDDNIHFQPDEIELIMRIGGRIFHPLIIGQLADIIAAGMKKK